MNWLLQIFLSLSMWWELEKIKWARTHAEQYESAWEESHRYCSKCKKIAYEDYMLRDELWDMHCSRHELMHITCFEELLGRKLKAEDFSPAPINDNIRWALESARE